MNSYDLLLKSLPVIDEEPAEVTAATLRAFPPEEALPSPWTTWALIALIRHESRQRWVAEVVRTKLNRLEKGSGIVPGLHEWEYRFHGRGCCLTHRASGEEIDVDFYGPDGASIDICFYIRYLRKLRRAAPPEHRLVELHPWSTSIRIAVADLWAGRVVKAPVPVTNVYDLARKTRKLAPLVERFARAWKDPGRRLWLGALIGDWMAAHEAAAAAGHEDLMAVTARRAEACRRRRAAWLQEIIDTDGQLAEEALLALHSLGAGENLSLRLREALQGPITGMTVRAVEIIEKLRGAEWRPQVEGLWERLDPDGNIPQPHLWGRCLDYFLAHDYRTDKALAALPRAGSTQVAAAALVALERAPEHALALFRRALRSTVRTDRIEAAAVLALIDRHWSRGELLAVLNESDDREATAECRAALLDSRHQGAHGAVAAWESKQAAGGAPGAEEPPSDVVREYTPMRVRYYMERWHDRVMPLRPRVPPEPKE